MTDTFQNPFEGDADFQYLALDRKKLMEEAPPFDAKTSCWIVDQKEGYIKANIKSTKGEEVTVITETLEVSRPILLTGDTNYSCCILCKLMNSQSINLYSYHIMKVI